MVRPVFYPSYTGSPFRCHSTLDPVNWSTTALANTAGPVTPESRNAVLRHVGPLGKAPPHLNRPPFPHLRVAGCPAGFSWRYDTAVFYKTCAVDECTNTADSVGSQPGEP